MPRSVLVESGRVDLKLEAHALHGDAPDMKGGGPPGRYDRTSPAVEISD
jgi:hypothetical protein